MTRTTKNSKPDYRAGLNAKGEISIKTSKGSMDSDSESGFPTYVPPYTSKESGEASGSAAPNQENDNSSAKRGGDQPDEPSYRIPKKPKLDPPASPPSPTVEAGDPSSDQSSVYIHTPEADELSDTQWKIVKEFRRTLSSIHSNCPDVKWSLLRNMNSMHSEIFDKIVEIYAASQKTPVFVTRSHESLSNRLDLIAAALEKVLPLVPPLASDSHRTSTTPGGLNSEGMASVLNTGNTLSSPVSFQDRRGAPSDLIAKWRPTSWSSILLTRWQPAKRSIDSVSHTGRRIRWREPYRLTSAPTSDTS